MHMKETMIRTILILIALIITTGLLTPPVMAFDSRSGDNIVINEPVDDDLIATGGSMIVNAPVKSITWAGGTLIVNEPVEKNLIAAGGTIQVNAPVGTDLLAAGGNIDINGDVGGKIMAVGGSVTMSGNAENIAASGGTVVLSKNTVIRKDAMISASGYTTQATILGNLTVEEGTPGSAGCQMKQIGDMIGAFISIVMILMFFGFLILGIIFVKLCPAFHAALVKTGKEKTLLSFVAGIAGLVIGGILCIILLITIIGIPLALLIFLLILIGLLLANILSGALVGEWIQQLAKKDVSPLWGFIVGFVVLNAFFFTPVVGFFIWIIAILLGFGMMVLTCYEAYADTGL